MLHGELSEGMRAALHGIWAGRAVWFDKKQKKRDADIEAIRNRGSR